MSTIKWWFNLGTHKLSFQSYNVPSTVNLALWFGRWQIAWKNKNWDDATLNFSMDVEGGNKVQTTSSVFDVHVTSLKNHLYGITQSCKRGKSKVLQKGEERVTHFKNGILGLGWLKWFKKHDLDLSLKVTQTLLKPKNLHKYQLSQTWNCDELDAQASWDGGALVLAKTYSMLMRSITLDEWEWLLVCHASMQKVNTYQIYTYSNVSNSTKLY